MAESDKNNERDFSELSEPELVIRLVKNFASGLPEATRRIKYIQDNHQYGNNGLWFTGGYSSNYVYHEIVDSFVRQNDNAVIILSQAFIEHELNGHVKHKVELGERPAFKTVLNNALELSIISQDELEKILQLIEVRNPLLHPREVLAPDGLLRKSLDEELTEREYITNKSYLAVEIVGYFLIKRAV